VSVVLAALPVLVMLGLTLPSGLAAWRLLRGARPGSRPAPLGDRAEAVERTGLGVVGLALGALGPWQQLPVPLWGLAASAVALVALTAVLRWRALPGVAADARGRRRPRARLASAAASGLLGLGAAVALTGALAG
jgi:hypothetical protein